MMHPFRELFSESAANDIIVHSEARQSFATVLDSAMRHLTPDNIAKLLEGKTFTRDGVTLAYRKSFTPFVGYPDGEAFLFRFSDHDVALYIPKDAKSRKEMSDTGVMIEQHPRSKKTTVCVALNNVRGKEHDLTELIKQLRAAKSVYIHEFTHFHTLRRVGGIEAYKKATSNYIGADTNFGNYVSQPEELNPRYMEFVDNILSDMASSKVRRPENFTDFFNKYWSKKHLPSWWDEYLSANAKKKVIRRLYKLYSHLRDSKVNWDTANVNTLKVQHVNDLLKDGREEGLHYIGFGRFANANNQVKYLKRNKKLIPFKAKS